MNHVLRKRMIELKVLRLKKVEILRKINEN